MKTRKIGMKKSHLNFILNIEENIRISAKFQFQLVDAV